MNRYVVSAVLGFSAAAIPAASVEAESPFEKTTVAALLADLQASQSPTRVRAATGLANVRPVERRVVEALVKSLLDADDDVRAAVRTALETLSTVEGFAEVASGVNQGPKAIRVPKPEYEPIAREARVQGVVILEILVDRTGNVTEATVVQGIPLLDGKALESVRRGVFSPAVQDGLMVPARARFPVTFRLR